MARKTGLSGVISGVMQRKRAAALADALAPKRREWTSNERVRFILLPNGDVDLAFEDGEMRNKEAKAFMTEWLSKATGQWRPQ